MVAMQAKHGGQVSTVGARRAMFCSADQCRPVTGGRKSRIRVAVTPFTGGSRAGGARTVSVHDLPVVRRPHVVASPSDGLNGRNTRVLL
jgi:hypothetical protein